MADGITVLRPDQHTADLISIKAKYVEQWIRGEVTQKCARFYVLMQRIGESPVLTDLLRRSGAGTDAMMADIDACRERIQDLARTVAGLDSGELELVAWRRAEGYPPGTPEINTIAMGVWRKGRISQHGEPGSMQWIPLPVLVMIGVATAGVGAWLLNLHLAGEKISAEADYLRAQTESVMANAIAAANPADRQGLANAYDQAQRAASSAANQGGAGWLSSIGQGIGNLATAAVNTAGSLIASAESWLPWAIGGWFAVQALSALSNIFGGRRCC